jgi:hypothetical protein
MSLFLVGDPLHGLLAGTDTPMLWTQVVYAVSSTSLAGLAIYRALRAPFVHSGAGVGQC